MQEKVHFTPPEIKIFEGKPPPQSWVEQNIVRHFQIKSEHNLLEDVKTYAQELQSQNLAKARPKPLEFKESFAPMPEKGSAKDVANTATFNSAQMHVKTEMEYLTKLITILKKGDPSLASELESLLGGLKQMAKDFPKLSPDQLASLSKMMEKLTEMAKNVPGKSQRAFWRTSSDMLQTMMTNNKGNMDDFQNEIKELQARIKMLTEIESLLNNIKNGLKAKPPSSKQMQQLTEDLQNLGNKYPHLNQNQQQALVNFFQQLGLFKDSKGNSLDQKFADSVVGTKIQEFLKAKPNATKSEIVEHLRKFLGGSNLLNSHLPFMKKMGESIEDVLSKKDFPTTEGFSGVPFASEEGGKVVPQKNFAETILKGYEPDENSQIGLAQSADKLTQTTRTEIEDNQGKVRGYEEAHGALGGAHADFGKGACGAAAGGANSGSLPNQFDHAILGHYMPGQEAYLRELAMLLFIDNMGAEAGNALLTKIMGFGEAADNYDFSNWLHSSGKDFSGSESKAKQQLSREKAQVSNDLNRAHGAENTAQSQINKINSELKNKNLTASQRQTLENQKSSLEGFIKDLKVAVGQLNDLKSILDQIHIHGPTGKGHTSSKYFSITGPKGWQSTLGTDEDHVVNGNPKNAKKKPPEPTGGLVNIQSNIQAFQQKYSDQGQNQQMMLQMRMTEIQQEWTVVSTALQLLNQMYMSVAQAIYK